MLLDWTSVAAVLILIAGVLLAAPYLGEYMALVFLNRPVLGDTVLNPLERSIYRLLGTSPRESMRVRDYALGLLLFNAAVALWSFLVLYFQGGLFAHYPGFTPMSWDLAFHTAASFATNTDYTHFSTHTSLTEWGGILALMVPFFTSAATGLAVAAAFARGFLRRDGTLGNVYVDIVRSVTRILLPISVLAALVYLTLGVPDTFTYYVLAHAPGQAASPLFLGPVAPWQAIEVLGTNGGGYYTANAFAYLATPSVYVTELGMVLMLLIALSMPFAFAQMVRRPGEAYPLIGTALAVFFLALFMFGYFEASGNLLAGGYRYPYPADTAFQLTSVYSNTGATNLSIGQLQPLAQMVLLFGMFTQATPGGVGTGFGTLLINVVLAVFLAGLMVGRSPEYLGKRIGIPQVKWSAAVLLTHPLLVLIPTSVAIVAGYATFGGPAATFCSSSGCVTAHNFTAVLYEFTSEAANNGSGYGPINDGTLFFNVVGALVMLLGRFVPIVGMLVVASHFSEQEVQPAGPGTLRTRSVTFTFYLTLILVVVTALLFLPVLALGPLSQVGG